MNKARKQIEAQDEVDTRKENLISKIEKMLDQKVEQTSLFTFHWIIQ